jgi:hypothetical protein
MKAAPMIGRVSNVLVVHFTQKLRVKCRTTHEETGVQNLICFQLKVG